MLGLSFGNLDKFKAEPLDTHIHISAEETGLGIDVLIFSGETEEAMAQLIALRGFPRRHGMRNRRDVEGLPEMKGRTFN